MQFRERQFEREGMLFRMKSHSGAESLIVQTRLIMSLVFNTNNLFGEIVVGEAVSLAAPVLLQIFRIVLEKFFKPVRYYSISLNSCENRCGLLW